MALAGLALSGFSLAFVSVYLAYALGMRAYLRRRQWREGLPLVAHLVDLVLVGLHFPLETVAYGRPGVLGDSTWFEYLLGTLLMAVQVLSVLRASRKASLMGAVLGSAIFLGEASWLRGFHPTHLAVAVLLLGTGGIGVAAARRARKSLDTLSRLQLLRRYLSPAAVERVLVQRPDAALALGGEQRTVTMLSADLRGFTSLSELLDPNEVVLQLNAYHGAMVEQLDRHGGVLDKFIGDGTLAIFGLEEQKPGRRGGGRAGLRARHARRAGAAQRPAPDQRTCPPCGWAWESTRARWWWGTSGRRAAGWSSRSSAMRSTPPAGSRGSPRNWGARCCSPRRRWSGCRITRAWRPSLPKSCAGGPSR